LRARSPRCHFFAVGIDAISARDAFDTGYPGFAGLGLIRDEEAAMETDDPYAHAAIAEAHRAVSELLDSEAQATSRKSA